MRLVELERSVLEHKGTFLCERIGKPAETRSVAFRHEVTPPRAGMPVPKLPGLIDFYDTFGSIIFYFDDGSGDAAVYIAEPSQWQELKNSFSSWIDDMDEEERADLLPDWTATALVIGEEPHTGNYLLIPTEGSRPGAVFLFDHDGFEFSEQAKDLVEYASKLLDLKDRDLAMIATHMRFAEGDRTVQWWIRELSDTRGNVARTKE